MKRLRKIYRNVTIGQQGPFDVYALDNFDFCENLEFEEEQGIYMFTNLYNDAGTLKHYIYYIGKTTDYDSRFYRHHKENQLKHANPNCIAIHACNKQEMDKLEVEWIEFWKPIYNIQHNS